MAMARSPAKNMPLRISTDDIPEHVPPGPSPRAWVARVWLRADGKPALERDVGSLAVFAVSVHEAMPASPAARLLLMRQVADAHASAVAHGGHSLWVFPAGFFGFDAHLFTAKPNAAWDQPVHVDDVERAVSNGVLPFYPEHATLVFGADQGDRQFAIVLQKGTQCRLLPSHRVERHHAQLSERRIQAGPLAASVFVCGEFCGSRTEANGAFYEPDGLYLDDPCAQLGDCRLLIDLAHSRVSGTVHAAEAPPRYSHQRQLETFSRHGAGLLVHHHGGKLTGKRPGYKHQSNWLIFRGGRWLDKSAVIPLM